MTTPIDINDEDDIFLTEEQQKESLRRQAEFESGKTTARSWEEILAELEKLYSNDDEV